MFRDILVIFCVILILKFLLVQLSLSCSLIVYGLIVWDVRSKFQPCEIRLPSWGQRSLAGLLLCYFTKPSCHHEFIYTYNHEKKDVNKEEGYGREGKVRFRFLKRVGTAAWPCESSSASSHSDTAKVPCFHAIILII